MTDNLVESIPFDTMQHKPVSDPEVERMLDAWTLDHMPDPGIADGVIAQLRKDRQPAWKLGMDALFDYLRSFQRWIPVTMGAACILLALGLWVTLRENRRLSRDQIMMAYMSAVDPVFRMSELQQGKPDPARLAKGDSSAQSLTRLLHLIGSEFALDPASASRMEQLHRAYLPLIEENHRILEREMSTYAGFEQSRKQNEVVDFLMLFDWIQRQKEINESSRETTRKLLGEMLSMLPPAKREILREAIVSTPEGPLI